MDIKQIITALGPDDITRRLKVTKYSLRAAKRDGVFPALWYAEILKMGEEKSVPIEIALFNFKRGGAA